MDLICEKYIHEVHYQICWPIFSQYWKEVNGKDLEKIKNVFIGGRWVVSSELEETTLRNIAMGSFIKVVLESDKVLGFLQYRMHSPEIVFVESLYVSRETRYSGVSRFVMNSFPHLKKVIFEVRKDRKPEALLMGLLSCKKITDSKTRDDLELWWAEWLPESQGLNENVTQIKGELKKCL